MAKTFRPAFVRKPAPAGPATPYTSRRPLGDQASEPGAAAGVADVGPAPTSARAADAAPQESPPLPERAPGTVAEPPRDAVAQLRAAVASARAALEAAQSVLDAIAATEARSSAPIAPSAIGEGLDATGYTLSEVGKHAQREALRSVLRETHWNLTRAASHLRLGGASNVIRAIKALGMTAEYEDAKARGEIVVGRHGAK